ncbi:sensor histidine kinase [Sediminibacterium goheungense]|uniref:histidine kinase n=1 Tax=Sediminibacterium goheungense TaxID=1086393 RepID=A0A4R6J0A4_9BACT|nr:HAMP domain-containing sensor histidine kinase [Sediminibacterium goheungense]TDO28619.1 signal transduction histidine kinase [Sediminibacterium goheungense]
MKTPLLFQKAINIGIRPELDLIEQKKTRLLNFMVILGQLHSLAFIIVNIMEGHYWNVGLLSLNVTGGLLFLFINSYHFIQTARIILTILSTASLCLSSIMFQNGNEYYFITNLVVISLIFKRTSAIIWLSVLTITCFVFIRFTDTTPWMLEPLPHSRVFINMTSALILAFLGLIYYRFEQRFYEQQLQQSQVILEKKNSELEESNTTKEKLFSIIAHDLRSPIAQLRNILDMLNKQLLSQEDFYKLSEHISLNVKQLQGGLDNLLQWSNSQLQGIEAHPQKVDFKSTLAQVISLMQAEIENKSLGIHIESEGGPIWADPNHLQLVLRNLLSNAVKYSYKSGVIHIHHYTLNHEVIISIADEGDGMDTEMQKQLFSAANIISKRGTLNEKGTGLGLKLCKEFVDKNNGKIWVEAREPKGSIFFVSFPATI